MNKSIVPNSVIVIFVISIGFLFVSQKSAFPEPNQKTEDSPFGFHTSAIVPPFEYGIQGPYDCGVDIGVKWERPSSYFIWTVIQPDINKQQFNWAKNDEIIQRCPDSIRIMANIIICSPRRTANSLDYIKDKRSYLPKDEDAYKRFIMTVVERYDGDGKDDMPGLKNPIKYWQIDNEPSYRISNYAELLKIAYAAVKEADPSAKVMIGGVTGFPPVFEYLKRFDNNFLLILKDLAKDKNRYFDIFDFHWYGNATGDYRGAKEVYFYIKDRIESLGLPLPNEYWITEMGTYSGDPELPMPAPGSADFPYQSEKQQASDVVKRYVYPISFGVKKIFLAFGLKEGLRNDSTYFDYTGLIYDGKFNNDLGKGVKKLAYYTYKKMAEILERCDWNSIQTIQESDGIYIYRFKKGNESILVAWNDNTEANTITISGFSEDFVKITEAVPKYKSGKDVKDYNTAFNTDTKSVQDGKITVKLYRDVPVFIEKKQ